MLVSCSRCGRIHPRGYKCNVGRADRADKTAYKLRASWEWQKKSREIKDKSRWLCAVCKDNNKLNHAALEVHHIVKVKDNETKAYDDYNLICLCVEHHKLADAGKIDVKYLLKLATERENNPPR